MALYKPMILSTGAINNDVKNRKIQYENECLAYAEELASKTQDELVKYLIYRYRMWVRFDETDFPVLVEYQDQLDALSDHLELLKTDLKLHTDVGYRKQVLEYEKSIKLLRKALNITNAMDVLIDEYEQVLMTGEVALGEKVK